MERRLTAFLLPVLAALLITSLLLRREGTDTAATDVDAIGAGVAAAAPVPAAPPGGSVGQDSGGQDSGGQDSVGQDSVGQDSVGQDSGGQDSGGQDSVGQDSVGQDSVGQDSVGQDSVGQDSVGQDNGGAAQRVETIAKRFGAIGEHGALWVEFDRRGGAVWQVRMLDQVTDAEAHDKPVAERALEDCYLAVQDVEKGLVSLSLEETDSGDRQLGVDLYRDRWDVRQSESEITFSLRDDKTGLVLERVYRWEPSWRGLVLTLRMRADAQRPAGVELDRELRATLYGPSLVNPETDHFFQNPALAIGAKRAGDDVVVKFDRASGKVRGAVVVASREGGYHIDFAGSTNRFFAAFMVPVDEPAEYALYRAEAEEWPRNNPRPLHPPRSVPVVNLRLRLKVPEPGATTETAFRLYLGPKSSGVFGEDPRYERFDEVMDVDLTPPCFCTIPGARQMARLLLWVLRTIEGVVSSWGVAIILMTLLVRGSLVPLNFRMQKSMRKFGAKMARLKPEMDAIKKRNESDPKKLQQELAAFQREHKLLPPIGGCLPLFITFPVFIGLFTGLRVAYELRLEPFLWWNDLSQPDALFQTGLDWLPTFNVLPIIMVVMWFVLQLGTPLPSDPQQQQVMKIMRFMPLMFGVMLYNYASGLMVYMITSSLFGIIEQRVTRRVLGPPPEAGIAPMAPAF